MSIFGRKLFTIEDGVLLSLRVDKPRLPWYDFWSRPEIATTTRAIHSKVIERILNRISRITKRMEDEETAERQQDIDYYSQKLNQIIEEAVKQAVLGSKTLPSKIKTEGEKSLSAVARALIENIQKTCQEEFHAIVHQNLAQMIIFARDEIADSLVLSDLPLPVGTRYVYRWGEHTYYVIEETPRVRTITWDGQHYRLSFPYCIFLMKYKKTRYEHTFFYFRNTPITNTNDSLFGVPLPDLSNEGLICFPDSLVYPDGGPAIVANYLQTVFWNSNFRSEHWGHRVGRPITREQWVRLTKDTPSSIVEINWHNTPYKVNQHDKRDDNPADNMARLEKHVLALDRRVSTAIGEAIIGKISTAADVKIAQSVFSATLTTAIKNAKITDRVKAVLESQVVELNKPHNQKTRQRLSEIGETIARNVVVDMEAVYDDQRN